MILRWYASPRFVVSYLSQEDCKQATTNDTQTHADGNASQGNGITQGDATPSQHTKEDIIPAPTGGTTPREQSESDSPENNLPSQMKVLNDLLAQNTQNQPHLVLANQPPDPRFFHRPPGSFLLIFLV